VHDSVGAVLRSARLKRANTLPLTIVLAVIVVAEIVFFVMRRCFGSCKGEGAGDGDDFEESFTVACERNLLQGAKTYHVRSQVRYENNIPSSFADEDDRKWWKSMIGDSIRSE